TGVQTCALPILLFRGSSLLLSNEPLLVALGRQHPVRQRVSCERSSALAVVVLSRLLALFPQVYVKVFRRSLLPPTRCLEPRLVAIGVDGAPPPLNLDLPPDSIVKLENPIVSVRGSELRGGLDDKWTLNRV